MYCLPYRAAVVGCPRLDPLSLGRTRREVAAAAVALRPSVVAVVVVVVRAPAEGEGGFLQRGFGGLCVRFPFGEPPRG